MIRAVPSSFPDSFELAAAARRNRTRIVGDTLDVAGAWLLARLKEPHQRIGGFTVQGAASLQRPSLH